MLNDHATKTIATTAEELAVIDWKLEAQIPLHPVRTMVTEEAVSDLDGTPIARIEPGYRFFWAHGHIHVARKDEDLSIYKFRLLQEMRNG